MPKHQTMTVEEFLGISGKPKKYPPKEMSVSGYAYSLPASNLKEVSLWFPKFSRETHPNSSIHWRKKAKAKKLQKEMAAGLAKQAMGDNKPWQTATVQPVYFFGGRTPDFDNILAWIKSALDGTQGIIIEDDKNYTPLPAQRIRVEQSDPKCGGMMIVFTKLS